MHKLLRIAADLATLRTQTPRALTAAAMPDGPWPWSAALMVTRFPTGDARLFRDVTTRELPLPFTIDHEGVRETIGRIDTAELRPAPELADRMSVNQRAVMDAAGVEGEPQILWGTGVIGDGPDGPIGERQAALARETAGMVMAGWLRGVSVEVDDVRVWMLIEAFAEDDPDEPPVADNYFAIPYGRDVQYFPQARVGAASIVTYPAFAEAALRLDIEGAPTPPEVEGASTSSFLAIDEAPADRWAFVAAVGNDRAPLSVFAEPEPDGPTPFTVTETRRWFSHLGLWGECHRGYPGECFQIPPSPSDYGEWMLGGYRTREGHTAAIGRVSIGGNHAPLAHPDGSPVTRDEALDIYANSTTGVAIGAAVDGVIGPWASGIIPDHVSDETIDELLACPPSGDWREIPGHPLGELDCIAVLAVNSPGFAVPRARVASLLGDCGCDDACGHPERVRALVAGAGWAALYDIAQERQRTLTGLDLADLDGRMAGHEGRLSEVEATLRTLGLGAQARDVLRSRVVPSS